MKLSLWSTVSWMLSYKTKFQVITKQASVQRCNATVIFYENSIYPANSNNKELHERFRKVAGDMLGPENVKEMQPIMGAEDFAFFAERVPGLFFFLGFQNETEGPIHSGHSPYYRLNEDIFPYGAALHASLATTYLLETPTKHTSPPEESYHDEL